ncbi:COG1361 S-layer family protein [Halorientalis pallida]|uniref:CARDB domain-containing protein n=1 Tax=Halorientalis pallida TaxID=2479928 RepID=A0A498KUX6_9EURY|nr:COG1361 S-layer family protein [Halorientalis pallida]RXK48700.1 hypothetical protein EAF64_13595 [Halorientalis pallida]
MLHTSTQLLTSSRHATILIAVLVALSTIPLPAAAAENLVTGEPEISISSPDATFEASSSQTLSLSVTNDGEIRNGGEPGYEQEVQTARNMRIEVLEDRISAPIEVKTGSQIVSRLASGGTVPLQYQLEIGDAKPGTYRIPVKISYEHTRAITYGPYRETERTRSQQDEIQYITITIEDKPQFSIVETDTNAVHAGDNGEFALSIKNTGTREATDTRVTLSTQTSGVYFGKGSSPSQTTSAYLSSLAPNETRRISTQVGASTDVSAGTYPIAVTAEYENVNGIPETSDRLQTGLTIKSEREFTLQSLSTMDFRVDEPEATIQGEIANAGSGTIRNAVVQMNQKQGISITNGEAAVGDLGPGQAAPLSFTVNIPAAAEPGSQSFSFTVEYENADGDVLTTSTPIRKSLQVGPERDRFEVVGVNTSVAPGGSDTLTVDLRYIGSEPVENANAKLFTSDPLSASDDGAYLGTIEPNETVSATFQVSATGDSLNKSYSSSIEVRYDEQDGDTRFSGSLSVGVPVKESSSGGIPFLPAGILAGGIVLVGGFLIYRRR